MTEFQSEPQTGSDAQPETQKSDAAALQAKLSEAESKYLYLYADFENYKKRAIKERSDLLKFGWESSARELLQILDNLQRGLAHVPAGTDAGFLEGLRMTSRQFEQALEKQGVRKVESLGKVFNPELHEAVGQEASDLPSGEIVKVEREGYTLHGRLLRPARVVISNGQPEKSKSEEK